MSIEVTPLGVACNLSCTYCYQHPMRDAGNFSAARTYDMDKMIAALRAEGGEFSVFGGEPLLVPLEDLEQLFIFGHAQYKKNGIQTNGALITPAHIALFKQYNVHVGFSLDGPAELNDSRWAGTLEKTRATTIQSHHNLAACIAAGVATSVIVTLYAGNARGDRLPRLLKWLTQLDEMGTRGVRIHLLEVDHPIVRERMQLSKAETLAAVRALVEFERTLPSLRFDILTDMRNLLRGEDEHVTCTWNPCDPYTTSAVRGVDGQGNLSNCGRTNKDGIQRLKSDTPGYERQLALYRTPWEDGGCKDCRFFAMCKGQCPGTAIDGDWRNRSADCEVWFALFEMLEDEMQAAGEVPLSLADARPQIEAALLRSWGQGQLLSLKRAKRGEGAAVTMIDGHGDAPHGDSHGDHTDHGDAPHGDHDDVG